LLKSTEIVARHDAGREADSELVEELSKARRSTGGHSFGNHFRQDQDLPDKQMLIKLADKMAPGWSHLSWTEYRLIEDHGEIEVEETRRSGGSTGTESGSQSRTLRNKQDRSWRGQEPSRFPPLRMAATTGR
jgi:hypothetical protein